MQKKHSDICEKCIKGPYEKCNVSFEQLSFDVITRAVAKCKSFEEKPKHRIKITYECEGKIAVEEKDVYDLPDVKWKKKAAAGLGEFQNVLISDEELEKLKRDFPHEYAEYIESLSEYIAKSPKKAAKYNSHYAVVRSWINRDRKNKRTREDEAKAREARRNNKDKLSSSASYNLNQIKQSALNNTEI